MNLLSDERIVTVFLIFLGALLAIQAVVWLVWTIRAQNPPALDMGPNLPMNGQDGMMTQHAGQVAPLPLDLATGFDGYLVVMSGLPSSGQVRLPGTHFTIGRFYNPSQGVLVALNERSLSRQHVRFEADTNTQAFYLTDINSSYGTRIQRDGTAFEPLTPNQRERVFNGDVVQFGTTVTARFVLPGNPRPNMR